MEDEANQVVVVLERLGRDAPADLRRQTLTLTNERTRLAQLRYDNGAASYLDVLDAQRSLFAAQQAVVQAQALQAQTLVNLYKVLGGGWNDAVAR